MPKKKKEDPEKRYTVEMTIFDNKEGKKKCYSFSGDSCHFITQNQFRMGPDGNGIFVSRPTGSDRAVIFMENEYSWPTELIEYIDKELGR